MPPVDIRHLADAWQDLWVTDPSLRLPLVDRKMADQLAVEVFPARDTVSAPRPAPVQLDFGNRNSPEIQAIVEEFLDMAEFNDYLTPLPDYRHTVLAAPPVEAATTHGASVSIDGSLRHRFRLIYD